jgi:hypothetical protein
MAKKLSSKDKALCKSLYEKLYHANECKGLSRREYLILACLYRWLHFLDFQNMEYYRYEFCKRADSGTLGLIATYAKLLSKKYGNEEFDYEEDIKKRSVKELLKSISEEFIVLYLEDERTK